MQRERPSRHFHGIRGGALAGLVIALAARLAGGAMVLAAGIVQAQPAAPPPVADPPLRFGAPLTLTKAAPFVQLALLPEVYRHSRSPGLADLRLVDAAGQRVPFAWLPQPPAESRERQQPVVRYAWPAGGREDRLPPSVDLTVDGGRITLRQRPGAATAAAGQRPDAGWLFDLGPLPADRPRPVALQLQWPEGASFSTGYQLDLSDDLRQWRRAGAGQLMALNSPQGSLSQPRVPLPGVHETATAARFVRLRWLEPAQAPRLSGAVAVFDEAAPTTDAEPPAELRLQATAVDRGLELDLGGEMPLQQLDLALTKGTQVVPLRVLARTGAERPWQEVARGVVYRLERDGAVLRSPPLALAVSTRHLRLETDERAAALDAAAMPVRLQLRPMPLVFAAQGTPPYELRVGAAHAAPGALPVQTLVPLLAEERARFGRATLGAFAERAEAVQQQAREAALAAWRPRLLWAVLLAGVAGLGFMVWRLARKPAAAG